MTSRGPFQPKAFYDSMLIKHACSFAYLSHWPSSVLKNAQFLLLVKHDSAQTPSILNLLSMFLKANKVPGTSSFTFTFSPHAGSTVPCVYSLQQ